MRLLQRAPETPSLETWLSRDVPHERELAGELLDKMGREKALEALLLLYDREETKWQKRRRTLIRFLIGTCLTLLPVFVSALPPFRLIPLFWVQIYQIILFFIIGIIQFAIALNPNFRASPRQKNIVTALFEYDDNPLVADALCRALPYYHSGQENGPWPLLEHIQRVLPLLPDDKEALTKEARACLRNRIIVFEGGGTPNITPHQEADRKFYADWEIAVLQYFTRTQDKDALTVIRKIAKSDTYSDDGKRVQTAARAALQAFGETAA